MYSVLNLFTLYVLRLDEVLRNRFYKQIYKHENLEFSPHPNLVPKPPPSTENSDSTNTKAA
jgi:hypothetical protein